MFKYFVYLILLCAAVGVQAGTFIEQAATVAHDPEFQQATSWVLESMFEKLYKDNVGKKRDEEPDAPMYAAGANAVIKGLRYLNKKHADVIKTPDGTFDLTNPAPMDLQSPSSSAIHGNLTAIQNAKRSEYAQQFARSGFSKRDPNELAQFSDMVKRWYNEKTLPTLDEMVDEGALKAKKANTKKAKKNYKGKREEEDEEAEMSFVVSPFEEPEGVPDDYFAPGNMQKAKIPLRIEGTSNKYAACTSSGDDAYANWAERDAAIMLGFWELTEAIRIGGLMACCAVPATWGAEAICKGVVAGVAGTMTQTIKAQYNYMAVCGDLLDLHTMRTQALQTQQFYEQVVEMRRFQVEEALRAGRYVGSFMLSKDQGGLFEMVSDVAKTMIDELKIKKPSKLWVQVDNFYTLSRNTGLDMKSRYSMLVKAYQHAAEL